MASRLTRGELEMKPFKIIKSDPLFSTPLSIFEIDDSSNLNKKLISESRSWQKEKKSANVSNHGDSWHSPDGLMTRTEPGFAKISKIIPQVAAQYALQINPNLDIKNFRFEANAWVNITVKAATILCTIMVNSTFPESIILSSQKTPQAQVA